MELCLSIVTIGDSRDFSLCNILWYMYSKRYNPHDKRTALIPKAAQGPNNCKGPTRYAKSHLLASIVTGNELRPPDNRWLPCVSGRS